LSDSSLGVDTQSLGVELEVWDGGSFGGCGVDDFEDGAEDLDGAALEAHEFG
jgi:hypothetical protein